jgi:hypothetical protein
MTSLVSTRDKHGPEQTSTSSDLQGPIQSVFMLNMTSIIDVILGNKLPCLGIVRLFQAVAGPNAAKPIE